MLLQEAELLSHIEEQLYVPQYLLGDDDDDTSTAEDNRHATTHDAESTCVQCDTSVTQLKQETLIMVQKLEQTQADISEKQTPRAPTSELLQRRECDARDAHCETTVRAVSRIPLVDRAQVARIQALNTR